MGFQFPVGPFPRFASIDRVTARGIPGRQRNLAASLRGNRSWSLFEVLNARGRDFVFRMLRDATTLSVRLSPGTTASFEVFGSAANRGSVLQPRRRRLRRTWLGSAARVRRTAGADSLMNGGSVGPQLRFRAGHRDPARSSGVSETVRRGWPVECRTVAVILGDADLGRRRSGPEGTAGRRSRRDSPRRRLFRRSRSVAPQPPCGAPGSRDACRTSRGAGVTPGSPAGVRPPHRDDRTHPREAVEPCALQTGAGASD